MRKELGKYPSSPEFNHRASSSLLRTLEHATSLAENGGNRFIGISHCFAAFTKDPAIMDLFKSLNIDFYSVAGKAFKQIRINRTHHTALTHQFDSSFILKRVLEKSASSKTIDDQISTVDVWKVLLQRFPSFIGRYFTQDEFERMKEKLKN